MGRAVPVHVETYRDEPISFAPALLDEVILRELLDEVGLPLFMNFVARMSASALDHQARLAQAAQENDHASARLTAHALIGLLGHFGLKRATALARRIEKAPEPAREAGLALAELEQILSDSLELLPLRASRIAA